jgi:hypothetical protein
MIKNLLILIFFFTSIITNAQTCLCPPVHVVIFDFNNRKLTPSWYRQSEVIQPPKYTKVQEYEFYSWAKSPQLGAQGFEEKAVKENGTIRFSLSNFLLDPALKNVPVDADYIVWGNYETDSSNVILHVYLEDPRTKEILSEVTSRLEPFDSTMSVLSRLADAPGGGEETARKLTPVLQTLEKRRNSKRDSSGNNETAVHAMLEIGAAQTALGTKDSTQIQLKLFDCDGTPLKSRQVLLQLTKGESKVRPTTVSTDEKGIAIATFKAGAKQERIAVTPVYQYVSIAGKKAAAAICIPPLVITVGDTVEPVVNISSSEKKIKWHITIQYEEKRTSTNTATSSESRGEFTKSGTVDMRMMSDGPDENGYIMINTENDKILSSSVSGEVVDKTESKKKYLDGFEFRNDEYFGKAQVDRIGFDFEYDPSKNGTKAIVTGIYYDKKGHYTIRRTASDDSRSWDNPIEQDYGAYQATVGRSEDVIKRTSNGFIIDGGETINEEEDRIASGHSSEKGYIRYHITIVKE